MTRKYCLYEKMTSNMRDEEEGINFGRGDE